jgi:crotonobetainyl-CoA:carnitine CoA-transferase CaiB-like acyl-CoA transferase
LALLDVQVSSLSVIAANFLASGKVPERHGNQLSNAAPSDAMLCSDGFVMIMVATNPQFRKLCMGMGLDALPDDPRFTSNELRVVARDELMEILRPVFETRSRSEWIEQLSALGVPCGPINDFADVYQDPQVQARGNLVTLSDPHFGDIRVTANPVRLSRTPAQYKPIPTKLGGAVFGDSEWSRLWKSELAVIESATEPVIPAQEK